MTPKEKANYLVHSFVMVPDDAMGRHSTKAWIDKILAKKCALIAVDEIIDAMEDSDQVRVYYSSIENSEFWVNVKEEIEKL